MRISNIGAGLPVFVLIAASAFKVAGAAEQAPAPQPSEPLDRSAYFEAGALTSDDLRRLGTLPWSLQATTSPPFYRPALPISRRTPP